jgi:hypothetical protein
LSNARRDFESPLCSLLFADDIGTRRWELVPFWLWLELTRWRSSLGDFMRTKYNVCN